MTMRTAYVNGRVLDCATAHDGMGGVLVRDGVIEDWGAQVTADNCGRDSAIVDCEGHCLAAGLIDMQVSVREHEESHKETIFSALSSAACGGGDGGGGDRRYRAGGGSCRHGGIYGTQSS